MGRLFEFLPFSTVFQLYQDNGQVIMKGCVQRSPIYHGKKSLPQAGLEPRNSRSAGQRLTYLATGAFIKVENIHHYFIVIIMKMRVENEKRLCAYILYIIYARSPFSFSTLDKYHMFQGKIILNQARK